MCVTVLLEVSLIIVHFHLVFVRVFSFNVFFLSFLSVCVCVYVCMGLYTSSSSIVATFLFHIPLVRSELMLFSCLNENHGSFFCYFFCLSWSMLYIQVVRVKLLLFFFLVTLDTFFLSCSCYGCFTEIISHRLRAHNNNTNGSNGSIHASIDSCCVCVCAWEFKLFECSNNHNGQ